MTMANEVLNQYMCYDMDYHDYLPIQWSKAQYSTNVTELLCVKCMGRLRVGEAVATSESPLIDQDLGK